MGEEKRHEMMETLFGAESEDSDDEEVMERRAHPGSDEEVEGGGQVDAESEGERPVSELEREESEAERVESEAEREESDGDRSYDDDQVKEQRGRPIAGMERRGSSQQVSVSGSEQSHEGGRALEEEEDEVEQFHGMHNIEEEEDEEVEQVREQSDEGEDGKAADGVAEMRDVFGDSDEEEQEPDEPRRAPEEVSGSDDEASVQRGIRPEDIVPDAEQHEERYESDEEERAERHTREKPVGSPLQIDVPHCPPPGSAEKMHIVRVSNIMGIESKPFDPKTYIEEEAQFVTDESGHKQRLRLEDNVVRWRVVRDRDGNRKYESNARFVKWSDGSVQLLIGNEVLDTSIQKAHQDQGHLFIRHGKGILQSQGRLLQKMKFMPSSLSSKSHRLLTALVDSRNRKIYKVKNVITNKDPEKEKEEAEKLHQKRIRSKEDLQRKQEKIGRKYNPVRERAERQLSPGFLLREDGDADEVDEGEIQRQMEEESRAERRIMNAKRQSHPSRGTITITNSKGRRYSPPRRERYVEESDNQPSEYETDEEEEEARAESDTREDEVEEEEEEEQDEEAEEEEEEEYEDEHKGRASEDREDDAYKKRRGRDDDSENERSPPRKPAQRRRVVVSESDED